MTVTASLLSLHMTLHPLSEAEVVIPDAPITEPLPNAAFTRCIMCFCLGMDGMLQGLELH